ncbi:MAG: HigA family addiction module antitoxin [Cytophagales bacterium]|nr:HigA family addiction module antitoxin [Cytophagales bacterium]
MNKGTKNLHPGVFIKDSVLPKDISVKKAAELLDVGRPALSNLLNGNASLSTEMALRLEKVFSADSSKLLQLQVQFDKFQALKKEDNIIVGTYAPSFLDIRATQIEAWADKNEARSTLPAFLRGLVNTTATSLSEVDFPAYDNSQRPGWDGQIKANIATQWIPYGKSGWEFGVSKDFERKANDDYRKRVANVSFEQRESTTFVFVTPRNWSEKKDWIQVKKEQNDWKDVRVYDANDLEQWLEQSIPTQNWFKEQLGTSDANMLSLDECWHRWAYVTKPELNKEFFKDAVQTHRKKLNDWITHAPERPFTVTADSDMEALAFLSYVFEDIGNLPFEYFDQVVVVRSEDALKKISKRGARFIAIIASPDVEKILGGFHKSIHTIIVSHKGNFQGEPDINLAIPKNDTFKATLTLMGIKDQEIEYYSRTSGQSPTVLRRLLSQIPSIKNPVWSQNGDAIKRLIPMILVGTWDSNNEADKEILCYITQENNYDIIEKSFSDILKLEESPVWSIDRHRGLVSKVDTLFCSEKSFTKKDIELFFDIAKFVLSEDDPALDLPQHQRWAANLYEKTRNHSATLRKGVCETLVLLSTHGNNLFQKRLGIDIKSKVDLLIRSLLEPFDSRTWLSQQNDLPSYAEAAPEEFLNILERDIKNDNPQILTLFTPADTGIFGYCQRTGLLWALELLAWKPKRLTRVTAILARLSQIKIDDNWANKPINSLFSIFRSWLPQTAADIEERKLALEYLIRKYPDIGWKICIDQFDLRSAIGHYNYRPQWRNDAAEFGKHVTNYEDFEFRRKALDLALEREHHDENSLGDLVTRLQMLPEEDIRKVWKLISDWNETKPDDLKKSKLSETIRVYAFTKRRRKKLNEEQRDEARVVYRLLKPKNLVIQHEWLFLKNWVAESLDEMQEDIDLEEREKRVEEQRSNALKEIWNVQGLLGIKQLLQIGDAASVIGWLLAKNVIRTNDQNDFILGLISVESDKLIRKIDECIAGFLGTLGTKERKTLIHNMIKNLKQDKGLKKNRIVRLLKCAPFYEETWWHVNRLSKKMQQQYWYEVNPRRSRQSTSEVGEFVNKLLQVNRPIAAFAAVYPKWGHVESQQLLQMLKKIVSSDHSKENYRISSYEISSAFEALDKRMEVSKDEIAELEFFYINFLKRSRYGLPNLEKQISKSPILFMQAVALIYKRRDGKDDLVELFGTEIKNHTELASRAYSLLHNIKHIPGTNDNREIDLTSLKQWIAGVRLLCLEHAREETGDLSIGQLLSNAPVGEDGIWPCEPVREALEDIGSEHIGRGVSVGIFNSGGATIRGGDGGDQERELAQKYRIWSQKLSYEYPYVSKILEDVAKSYDHSANYWDTHEDIRKRTEF